MNGRRKVDGEITEYAYVSCGWTTWTVVGWLHVHTHIDVHTGIRTWQTAVDRFTRSRVKMR